MRPRQFPSSAAVGLAATTALTVFIVGLAGGMAGPGSSRVQAQGNLPTRLLQPADVIHQGSFSVPDMVDGTGLACEWTQGVIAFNPANNSLFLVCHDWQQQVAEISIPALGGAATQLQAPRDAAEGRLSLISPVAGSTVKIGGMHVSGSQLILAAYVYYDASGSATSSHFVRSTNLSTPSVQGPYRVGSVYNTAFWAGYFAPIPSVWQAALGGDTLNGQCCLGIISRTSYGPSVSAVNKADLLAARNPTPATMLVGYPDAHQTLAAWDSTGPLFNGTTVLRGVLLPENTNTVLFFGFHGMGTFVYAGGTTASPYEPHVWAYRASDLALVKAGSKQPWEVFPYATFRLPGMAGPQIGGVALNPATGQIYVSENMGDGAKPRIHVFTISGSTAPVPLAIPPPPPPPADTHAPAVVIRSPLNGAEVSEDFDLVVTASDDGTLDRLVVDVDGVEVETTNANRQPMTLTVTVTPGPHTIRAQVYDMAGNIGVATVSVHGAETALPPLAADPSAPPIPGDFNGDQHPDILWQHQDGWLYAWFMEGSRLKESGYLSPAQADPTSRVVSLADMNRDGQSDLVWQDANGGLSVWIMRRTTAVTTLSLDLRGFDPTWRIAGSGDFNGDGKIDLVGQQPSTGALQVWFMDRTTNLSANPVSALDASPQWQVVGTSDLNADGKSDIVLHHVDSGALAVWFMNGAALVRTDNLVPDRVAASWRLAAFTDLNKDGSRDAVWEQLVTGHLYVWYLKGGRRIGEEYLSPPRANEAWRIVGGS